jgi:hypothetical protein
MILMLIVLTGMAIGARAQNLTAWFKQKETQRKYLLEQIAAMRLYHTSVKKGYALTQHNLTTIGGIKNGCFMKDKEYFGSLKKVRPKLKNQARVADIITIQVKIMEAQKHFSRQVRESGAFHAEEISFVNRVFKRLQDDCADKLDELILVTTDDKLVMADGERQKRIDHIYQQMQNKYSITQSFGRGAMVLGMARIQESQDISNSFSLHHLNHQAA